MARGAGAREKGGERGGERKGERGKRGICAMFKLYCRWRPFRCKSLAPWKITSVREILRCGFPVLRSTMDEILDAPWSGW